jgi:ATP-binding cassette subfamily C protein LapB
VVFGVLRIGEGALTLGGLIACVLLANRVLAPLAQISGVLTRWQQARQALSALDHVMRLPLEREPGENRVHRPTLAGALEFTEASFSYPGADLRALDGVSFSLAPGERVGLIGRVGSGKTTLLKLAQGLHLPDSGLVRVDAIDLRQLEPADLRRQVGYVAQQVALFRGTIRDNLALGAPEAGDEAILAAAELVGLGDMIRQAPRGLDQDVGEQGLALSGGQRQLIALARAIVQRPPILLLDEPTAGLDALAERAVIDTLRGRLGQATLLLATHRLPLFQLVDRLIVLERGRVLADGAREDVLKRLGAGRLAAATA